MSCVRAQYCVDNSKCLQGPGFIFKAHLWFQLQQWWTVPCDLRLNFSPTACHFKETPPFFLLLPRITSQINYLHPSSILWLCFLRKADCNKHFSSTIHTACAPPPQMLLISLPPPPILLPTMSSTTSPTSHLPCSKSKPQKISSPSVPQSPVFKLQDHHKLITYLRFFLNRDFIQRSSNLPTFSSVEYLTQWLSGSQKLLVSFFHQSQTIH